MALATDNIIIKQPWNLENDLRTIPDDIESKFIHAKVPGVTEDTGSTTISDDVMDSIFNNAAKKAKSSVDPYASKFQDASLSDRYKGNLVAYGDYKLDPKLLDDRYSKTQSWSEQSLNSLKIGLANGGAMFASGMIGLPDIIRNISNGKGIENSDWQNSLYDWSKSVADDNITFENEQDQKTDAWNTIKNVLLPSGLSGSSKGWGGIFESLMYGVGAGAALALQEAAVSFIAPGVGNSAILASTVARTINNIRSISKYGQLADRILDTSVALSEATSALRYGNKITDAAKWGYRSTIGAYGEAAFEGIEGEHSFIQNATEKFRQTNGRNPNGQELEQIQKLGGEAKSARFWTNMAMLMGSNTFQMKRMFRNFDLAKETSEQIAKQGLRVGMEEGKVVAKNINELKSTWWDRGFQKNLKPIASTVSGKLNTDFVKESLSEGLEEFTQGWIDKSVNNYYSWKLDHRGQPAMVQAIKSIGEGFSESWSTEGLRNLLSGAIAGVGQQAVFGAFGVAANPKSLNDSKRREEELNSTLSQYAGFNAADYASVFQSSTNVNSVRGTISEKAQNLNASGVIDEVANIAEQINDKKLYKDLETLSFFTLAEPYVSRGHADILKQQFNYSLENLSDEQVSDMFGVPLTRNEATSKFNSQVDEMNSSFSIIKDAFRNPFDARTQPTEAFNFDTGFVPELSYLHYRSKVLNERRKDIQKDLGDYYNEFKYFSDENDISKGRTYIENEIERISSKATYLKSLDNTDPTIDEEFNKDRMLVNLYKKSLKSLDEYNSDETLENYEKFLDEYYTAFANKVDRSDKGFIDRERTMNNLVDFNRITTDLSVTEKMLKSYLSKDGQQIFLRSYAAYARSEQRKREQYTLSDEFKEIKNNISEQHPELSEDKIDEILQSKNKQEIDAKVEEAVKQQAVKDSKIEATKDKIRNKFISSGRGDVAEDYLSAITVTELNEKQLLEEADAYLTQLSNNEFAVFRKETKEKYIESLKTISNEYEEENVDEVYDSLTVDEKIKHHEITIDYFKNLLTYKNLPKVFIDRQKKLIISNEESIKELKAIVKTTYTETVGDYNIIEEDGAFSLYYKEGKISSFLSVAQAKKFISDKLKEQEIKTDVSHDGENNLENKFENSVFNPDWFDDKGNKKVLDEDIVREKENRIALFKDITTNRSEKQVEDAISQNLVIDRYTTNPDDLQGKTLIYKGNQNSGKLQEILLKSVTNDAISISYNHETLRKVRIATYKNYKTDLEFVERDISKKVPNKSDRDTIFNFTKGLTYYEFLKKSLTDDTVFNMLYQFDLIGFKGSVQEQINLIDEKQKVFDFINNSTLEEIKEKVKFTREYTAINYDNNASFPVNEIAHSSARLKEDGVEYNKNVFFRVVNKFMPSLSSEAKIEFVGLENEFQTEAKQKIIESYLKKSSFNNKEVYPGYYMMLSDSNGNASTYKMENTRVDVKQWWDLSRNNFNDVMVSVEGNSFISIALSGNPSNMLVTIKNGSNTPITFQHPVNTVENVKDLIPAIYEKLGQKNVSFALTLKTESKPTTVGEMMYSRSVTGINKMNFRVDKIVPSFKQAETKLTTEIMQSVIEKPVQIIEAPSTISQAEIDDFLEKSGILQPEIITAGFKGIELNPKFQGATLYLNENANIEKLQKFLSKNPSADVIANTFRKTNIGDLFISRSTPKTNISSVEDRVQQLIKQCVK